MAKTTVHRDPFSRGEYLRESFVDGDCAWCGQAPGVTFSYVWWADGARKPEPPRDPQFCNLECFEAYHG